MKGHCKTNQVTECEAWKWKLCVRDLHIPTGKQAAWRGVQTRCHGTKGHRTKGHRQKPTRQKATKTKGHGTKGHRTQR